MHDCLPTKKNILKQTQFNSIFHLYAYTSSLYNVILHHQSSFLCPSSFYSRPSQGNRIDASKDIHITYSLIIFFLLYTFYHYYHIWVCSKPCMTCLLLRQKKNFRLKRNLSRVSFFLKLSKKKLMKKNTYHIVVTR